MKDLDGFSVITCTIREKYQNRVINNFISQKFENKELIIIINKDDMQGNLLYEYEKRYKNIRIFRQPEEVSLGACLNFAIEQANFNMIAKFDDDDFYSPYYLDEMYDAIINNKGDIVGKDKRYYYLEEFRELLLRKGGKENAPTEWIAGATLCFKKDIFNIVKFRELQSKEDTNFLKDSMEKGLRIFSTSRYNYIVYRKSDIQEHTWKIGIDYFINMCEVVKRELDFDNTFIMVSKDMVNAYIENQKKYEKMTTVEKYENYDKEYKEKVINLIKKIHESNGSRYYAKINKNIAIVTDEFMFNYYKDAVNLFYVNSQNYKEIFENNKIDLFLFITCWKGIKDNDWRGISNSKVKRQQLFDIIELCNLKKIKTIFQSIEDPSDYDTYVDIAKKCDYIFTTDSNKINNYKEDCKNNNVYPLEFGINPYIHNPIGMKTYKKFNEVLFAGAWMDKFEERCNDMTTIFDGVLNSNYKLNIVDRNYYLEQEKYYYPKKYTPYITQTIDYKDLQKIHKLYDWCVNLNSIKYSPTMCSRRIYEAQALGNLILSNYSQAVITNNDNIFIVTDKPQVKNILEKYDKEDIYEEQIKSIRRIMTSKTVYEKLEYICQKINLEESLKLDKKVLVITKKINPNIEKMFKNQTYINKYLTEERDAKNLYKSYDFVAFFNDKYIYGENYLQDMVNGFKYTNSNYITKDSYYEDDNLIVGIEHDYVNKMKDKYKSMFDAKFYELNFLLQLKNVNNIDGGYSIDHFELKVYNKNIKRFFIDSIKKFN